MQATSASPSLTVFLTAMNEEGNLRPTVENVLTAVREHFTDYEIWIIDDGSRDRTPEIAAALAASDPRVRVHTNDRNRGLAYSYRKGIELASKDVHVLGRGQQHHSARGDAGYFRARRQLRSDHELRAA